MSGAYLNSADLSGARLMRAFILEADLSGAILKSTNFSGATLIGTKHLDQSQLDQACGDEETILPKGLTIKACR